MLLTTGRVVNGSNKLDEYYHALGTETYCCSLRQDPSDQGERELIRLAADEDEYGHFCHTEAGKRSRVFCINVDPEPAGPFRPRTRSAPLYFPVHTACMHIADHFIRSIELSIFNPLVLHPDGVTSHLQLWEVLCRRFPGKPFDESSKLPEPHNYFYGEMSRCLSWEEAVETNPLMRQDPVNIPCVSQSILQNLKTLDISELEAPSSQNTASQDWYFSCFCNGQIFPWLWDLDLEVFHEKHRSGQWDWKRLAFELADKTIHEPGNTSLQLPLALRNRRRIWRLLEEARINDVSTREEERMVENRRVREQAESTTRSFRGVPPILPVPAGLPVLPRP
ncbi:MAG: hypothetical protein M1820_009437 [Bogoriella megaspora]|nr:MAG: hypothetical protein M1820_009437 [Bogoriella megaspora]